jgi:hypothetical protein
MIADSRKRKMLMSDSVREHLLATIAHISLRRTRLLVEIDQVEGVLKALYREVESLPLTPRLAFPDPAQDGLYAGISVRWSVLLFLAERATGAETLGTIADALRAGGSTSKAQSFNSNVSAVLSQMVSKGELAKIDDRFTLTDHGKAVWHGIRNSEKFLNRNPNVELSQEAAKE